MPDSTYNVLRILAERVKLEDWSKRTTVTAVVLFADAVGSTPYYERFGDHRGALQMVSLTRLCAEVAESNNGRMIKKIGDAAMCSFEFPSDAVYAAVKLQQEYHQLVLHLRPKDRLELRIGADFGSCIQFQEDLFGDHVNLAARIEGRCCGSQILVSDAVYTALPDHLRSLCHAAGLVELKGKTGKYELFEVRWRDSKSEQREERTETTRSTPTLLPQSATIETAPIVQTTASERDLTGSLPVELLKRYEILEQLGVGGMGRVFRVRDRETEDVIALKLLLPGFSCDPSVILRFRREVSLARRVSHPNVCRIFELLRFGEALVISMECVNGVTLRRALDQFGGFGYRLGLRIARQLCDGLAAAHNQGIVHRDLKPENVMIDEAGNAKIMDFGIAHDSSSHLTGTEGNPGTPLYAAPEQLRGDKPDAQTDLYSLGLVLYEMLTGTHPFSGGEPAQLVLRQLHDLPVAPREINAQIPLPVEAAVLRCLEKNPKARFERAEDLREAIAQHGAIGFWGTELTSHSNERLTQIEAPFDATNAEGLAGHQPILKSPQDLFRGDVISQALIQLYEVLPFSVYSIITLVYVCALPLYFVSKGYFGLQPRWPDGWTFSNVAGFLLMFGAAPLVGSHLGYLWMQRMIDLPSALQISEVFDGRSSSFMSQNFRRTIGQQWLPFAALAIVAPIAGMVSKQQASWEGVAAAASMYVLLVWIIWWYFIVRCGIVIIGFLLSCRQSFVQKCVQIHLTHHDGIFGLRSVEQMSFTFLALYFLVVGSYLGLAALGPDRWPAAFAVVLVLAYVSIPALWFFLMLWPLHSLILAAKRHRLATIETDIKYLNRVGINTTGIRSELRALEAERRQLDDTPSWPIGRIRGTTLVTLFLIPLLLQFVYIAQAIARPR
jgi:serine/threonine protein kinase/class 3 adenylate cyclase